MRAVETRGRALPKTKNPAGNAPRGRNQTAAHNAPQKKLGWHFVLKNQDSFSIYYSKAVLLYVIEIHLIN